MGADINTKPLLYSKTATLIMADSKALSVDTDLLTSEDSTLPIAKAVELINRCSHLKTHDDELKTFKEIGSKTPILPSEIGTDPNYKFTYVWFNYVGFIVLHIIGLSGAAAAILGYCSIWTTIYCEYLKC